MDRKELTLLAETPRLKVYSEQLQKADGGIEQRLQVKHPGAVVILAITDAEEFVFLRQYRRTIARQILELPAGTLAPGEDILDCAKRELLEETGYTAVSWQAMGTLLPAPGFCDELQHLFVARGLSAGEARPEEFEEIEVRLLPMDELKLLIKSMELLDAKSLAMVLRAGVLGYLPEALW